MNKNKFVSVMKLHGDTQESLAEAIGLSVQRMHPFLVVGMQVLPLF